MCAFTGSRGHGPTLAKKRRSFDSCTTGSRCPSSKGLAAQKLVHHTRGLTVHRWRHMPVHIERDCDRRMAEHFAHDLRIHTAAEQKRGSRVARAVESHGWNLSAGE